MSSQRPSFAKRDREQRLKDRARQKAERREARRSETRTGSGPPIAFDEPGGTELHAGTDDNNNNDPTS